MPDGGQEQHYASVQQETYADHFTEAAAYIQSHVPEMISEYYRKNPEKKRITR